MTAHEMRILGFALCGIGVAVLCLSQIVLHIWKKRIQYSMFRDSLSGGVKK